MSEKLDNLPAMDWSLVYALGELFECIADVAIALRINDNPMLKIYKFS